MMMLVGSKLTRITKFIQKTTKTISDNGLNPVWDETFHFKILNPDLALVRFCIYDEDIFEHHDFIGHFTLPVGLVQAGYRSVQLRYDPDLILDIIFYALISFVNTFNALI